MQQKVVDAIVASVFKEAITELKAGKEVSMNFYLFFKDSYWRFPDEGLGKDDLTAAVHIMNNYVKPEAYAMVSDTFVRHPETREVMYEMLIASIVTKGEAPKMIAQRYDRLPSGKISLSRPRQNMGEIDSSGRMVELFEPIPMHVLLAPETTTLVQPYLERLKKEKVSVAQDHMPDPGN